MSTDALTTKTKPQLRGSVERLRGAISVNMELTRQINNKVEDIGYLKEPTNVNKAEEPAKPNHFMEEMNMEIEKLEMNNKRLEEIRNKLNELI